MGLGDQKDDFEVYTRESVQARFISVASPDILEKIGGERQLPRGPIETVASYRARLIAAFETWVFAGTSLGLLRALHYQGYTAGTVYILIAQGEVNTLDTNLNLVKTNQPSGFAFIPAFWNVFQIIFTAPFPASWSGVPPGNTSDEVNSIRKTVGIWKSAQAILQNMVVVQGLVWGFPVGQNWGGGGLTWGGTPVIWSP